MKKFWILLAALAAFAAAPLPASAALQVDVNQGNIQPLPIAIPDFVAGGPNDAQAGANIAGVVRADLERSGLFRPLDRRALSSTSPTSTRCPISPAGAPSMRRAWSPAR